MSAPMVAILDDEPEIRQMLSDALQDAGFRTAGFGRATEFEAALRKTAPDVCLVDLGLPVEMGDVDTALKKTFPAIFPALAPA